MRRPFWRHRHDGLVLEVGGRADHVPSAVSSELLRPRGAGTTTEPAEDLIRMEGNLRRTIVTLRAELAAADQDVRVQRENLTAAHTRWSLSAWSRRRRIRPVFATAVQRHNEVAELLEEAVELKSVVREFVVELDVPDGLLHEAAQGWKRSPDVPFSAIVCGPEESFIAADSRRARAERGFLEIDADVYGEQWRRDEDDDAPDAEPLDRSGPWQVGYIPRTGEIYASRRCGYLPQEVWLLGTEFGAQQAHTVLDGVLPRMREPNSLILAAGVVHAARSLRGTRHCVALRRPGVAETRADVANAGDSG